MSNYTYSKKTKTITTFRTAAKGWKNEKRIDGWVKRDPGGNLYWYRNKPDGDLGFIDDLHQLPDDHPLGEGLNGRDDPVPIVMVKKTEYENMIREAKAWGDIET